MHALALEDAGLKSTFHNSLFPRGFRNESIIRRHPDAAGGPGGIRFKTGNCSDFRPAVQFFRASRCCRPGMAPRCPLVAPSGNHRQGTRPVITIGDMYCDQARITIFNQYVRDKGLLWTRWGCGGDCLPWRPAGRGDLRGSCIMPKRVSLRVAQGFSTDRIEAWGMWITRRLNDTIGGRFQCNGEVACHWLSGNNVWIPCRMN